jgi:hypothetical protein
MAQIDQIKAEIETLTPTDFIRLREWFAEKDWQQWDRQIEKDSASGKLEFLREEALNAKTQNKLRDL